jgi:hypothetical protein
VPRVVSCGAPTCVWHPYCAVWDIFLRGNTPRYCPLRASATRRTVRSLGRVSVSRVPVPAYQSATPSRQPTKERARVNGDPTSVANRRWGAAGVVAVAAAADPDRACGRDHDRGRDGKRTSQGICCNLARRAGHRRSEGTGQFRCSEGTNPFLPQPPPGTLRQPRRRLPTARTSSIDSSFVSSHNAPGLTVRWVSPRANHPHLRRTESGQPIQAPIELAQVGAGGIGAWGVEVGLSG